MTPPTPHPVAPHPGNQLFPNTLGEESEGIAGRLHNIRVLKDEGVFCVSISVNTPMLNEAWLSSQSAPLALWTVVVGPQGIIHSDWEAVLPLRRRR